MKSKTGLPRRRFLVNSSLAACALLVSRAYGKSRSAPEPTVALTEDDQAVIGELAAYSTTVYLWGGPINFPLRQPKFISDAKRSVKFIVLVNDFEKLALYLISGDLERLGVVYAGGPNLAFMVGTTAYTISNYGSQDFYRATS